MLLRIITIEEANRIAINDLRLDSDSLDLTSIEGISGLVRKVAGFKCPCTTRELLNEVNSLLTSLVPDKTLESIPEIIDSMISYGDLLELSIIESGKRRHKLFCAPPSFVKILENTILLLGIVPDHFSPLPRELESEIISTNHVRKLSNISQDDIKVLIDSGLLEFSANYWQRSPKQENSKKFLENLNQSLDTKGGPSSEEDFQILQSVSKSVSVKYYKGRWGALGKKSGHFIARRQRKYGNPLWCYILADSGKVEKVLNLPLDVDETNMRGCDEAWRILLALDDCAGHPQEFYTEEGSNNQIIIDYFSPLPRWATRRWDALGTPVLSRKALFSYSFSREIADGEIKYCNNMLWLKNISNW